MLGKIKRILKIPSGLFEITILAKEPDFDLDIQEPMEITFSKPFQKRSKDSNAYMWECLKLIADQVGSDKWDIYLQMLKRYGQFTYMLIKERAWEKFKSEWRTCEVVGEKMVDNIKCLQVLAYFGSSTYSKEEMSKLIDGIVSEIRDMGLVPPPTREEINIEDRLKHS